MSDEVLKVWKALLANGINPRTAVFFGDSAGEGLAAASVLKIRDQALLMPAAVYLSSPWSDLTDVGDTYESLAQSDPMLNAEALSWAVDAYAAQQDKRHPYVSPFYGDYKKGSPPTLIQGGTREIFVSTMVRHYQVLPGARIEAVLDLYEGMPHTFTSILMKRLRRESLSHARWSLLSSTPNSSSSIVEGADTCDAEVHK
ncbi:alpha/beta hydrolase fold domain-containing protein [Ectopseudomonas guguanensis]|uniref:alpha/beta hydrolase fold domain-containing protein n=1 Tax=Ectopseudomonas guguanensis TaxID=1198456 RepID=UPI003D35F2B0